MQIGRPAAPIEQSTDTAVRFMPVDALRGIAALGVLMFHLLRNSPQTEVLDRIMPPWMKSISDLGRTGVAIFFVISGFVIAYTTDRSGDRLRDGFRFSVRRQVRLDPPYYAVLLVVIAISLVERQIPALVHREFTLTDALLNTLYLQGITDRPALLSVAWTLCIEVQFYLVVVTFTMMRGSRVFRSAPPRVRFAVVPAAAVLVGLVSAALPFFDAAGGPWFISYWILFLIGMIAHWYHVASIPRWSAWAAMASIGGWLVALEIHQSGQAFTETWAGWLTGLGLMALASSQRLTAKPPKVLLFFGAISYSLYLIHMPVIDTVMALGFKLTGDSGSGAAAAYLLGATGSVFGAWVLHRTIEMRSMSWSTSLKQVSASELFLGASSRLRRR